MEDTMDIQKLKEAWVESNRQLNASIRLNALLLKQANLQKTGGALGHLTRGVAAELLVNFVGLVLLGSFAVDHVREPRFFVPALALAVYAIGTMIAGIRQIVTIKSIDYDEPVVVIQKRLEELRILRVRTTLGIFLFGPLMWVPLLIVALRGFFGVDAYAAGSGWLAANVLFGVAVIPVAIYVTRRFGNRLDRFGAIQCLADQIAGRSLVAALDSLDTIRRFELTDA